MDVTVTIGSEDEGQGVQVTISDDNGYNPDVADDMAARATKVALHVHAQLNQATDAE